MNEQTSGFQKMVGQRRAGHILVLVKLFLLVLVAYFGVSTIQLWRSRPTGNLPRQLAVSGEGKMAVKPDIAVFAASVVNQSAKVTDAQAENTRKYNAVVEYLKKRGIAERDIKTTDYNVYPQYDYTIPPPPPCAPSPSGLCPAQQIRPPQISSYQVRQTIEVRVRDLGKVDDLLTGVVSAGANEVGAMSFKIDDPEPTRSAARKKAIDNATAKAAVLARDLGVRLVRIVSYTDGTNGYEPYPQTQYGATRALGIESAAPGPQVQPGEQEITSNVSIVYEFE